MGEVPQGAEGPNGSDSDGEGEKAGKAAAPYVSYAANIKAKTVAVLANVEDVAEYAGKDCLRKATAVVEELGMGPCKELLLRAGEWHGHGADVHLSYDRRGAAARWLL